MVNKDSFKILHDIFLKCIIVIADKLSTSTLPLCASSATEPLTPRDDADSASAADGNLSRSAPGRGRVGALLPARTPASWTRDGMGLWNRGGNILGCRKKKCLSNSAFRNTKINVMHSTIL